MQRAVHLGLVGAVAVVLMGPKAPKETTGEQPPDPNSGADAMGEGPWKIQLEEKGPVAGRVFAVDVDGTTTDGEFEEYFERKDGLWAWLGPGTTWYVSVGPKQSIPYCGQQGNLACQRVTVKVQKGQGATERQPSRPTPFVEFGQYSAVGRYNVAIDTRQTDGTYSAVTCATMILTRTGDVITETINGNGAYKTPTRDGMRWTIQWAADQTQDTTCTPSKGSTVTGLTEQVKLTTTLQ